MVCEGQKPEGIQGEAEGEEPAKVRVEHRAAAGPVNPQRASWTTNVPQVHSFTPGSTESGFVAVSGFLADSDFLTATAF